MVYRKAPGNSFGFIRCHTRIVYLICQIPSSVTKRAWSSEVRWRHWFFRTFQEVQHLLGLSMGGDKLDCKWEARDRKLLLGYTAEKVINKHQIQFAFIQVVHLFSFFHVATCAEWRGSLYTIPEDYYLGQYVKGVLNSFCDS